MSTPWAICSRIIRYRIEKQHLAVPIGPLGNRFRSLGPHHVPSDNMISVWGRKREGWGDGVFDAGIACSSQLPGNMWQSFTGLPRHQHQQQQGMGNKGEKLDADDVISCSTPRSLSLFALSLLNYALSVRFSRNWEQKCLPIPGKKRVMRRRQRFSAKRFFSSPSSLSLSPLFPSLFCLSSADKNKGIE